MSAQTPTRSCWPLLPSSSCCDGWAHRPLQSWSLLTVSIDRIGNKRVKTSMGIEARAEGQWALGLLQCHVMSTCELGSYTLCTPSIVRLHLES